MANCVFKACTSLAEFETYIEALDDTKFLGMLIFRENGTTMEKIIVISKT